MTENRASTTKLGRLPGLICVLCASVCVYVHACLHQTRSPRPGFPQNVRLRRREWAHPSKPMFVLELVWKHTSRA